MASGDTSFNRTFMELKYDYAAADVQNMFEF